MTERTQLDPAHVVDAVTTIRLQRLRAVTRELVKTSVGYLGVSADRLTWGLTRDWHYDPDLRERWAAQDTDAARTLLSSLDERFALYSYRIESAAELRGVLEWLRAKPEQQHWWYFDAGSDRYDALRAHLDDVERALIELGAL